MSTPVVSVAPQTPVREIVSLLLERGISGVPVVRDEIVLGIVSEGDLLLREKAPTLPAGVAFLGGLLLLNDPARTAEELRKHVGATAEAIMSREVVWIGPETPITEAAELMLKRRIKRLPVVEGGRLVGIVTRRDLLRGLLGNRSAVPEA